MTVIRVYNETGNVIETHEHAGAYRQPWWQNLPKIFVFG
jgi:hypothetical protein